MELSEILERQRGPEREGPASILVVEDSRLQARKAMNQLQVLGYNAIGTVTSADAAFEFVAENKPDLVLMDIEIDGELNGLQAAAEMRRRFCLPVVFLSTHCSDEIIEVAKGAAPFAYLVKPVDDRELFVAVEIALHMHVLDSELRLYRKHLEHVVKDQMAELMATNERLEREIAERKAAAAERRQAEVQLLAQSKLATLGEIATGIAHEIRQPLTYISATLQLLHEGESLTEITAEKRAQLLQRSMRATQNIDHTIEHLRNFGRIDDLEMRPMQLEQVVDDALLLVREKVRLRNIHLVHDVERDLAPIRGCANLLEQVVLNLLQNAMDAIDEVTNEQKGNEHNAEIKMLLDSSTDDAGGDLVRLTVSDNGSGIPAERLPKIFQPFFTSKPVGRGTGLGLSISYGTITNHEGTITCESTVGTGTSFVILLPAYHAKCGSS